MTVLYEVAPRYTPGSPAMVPEETARRVARQENQAYQDAISWSMHPKHELARQKGVSWIVWERVEVRGRVYKRCMLTDEMHEYVAVKPIHRVKEGTLAGALVQIVRQSKRTGMITAQMVSDRGAYKRGHQVHLYPYELESAV